MTSPNRLDAVVLGTRGNSVVNVWCFKELKTIRGLDEYSYVDADTWLRQNGWILLDAGNQFAHEVYKHTDWHMCDAHFYVPGVARVVRAKDMFAIMSPANDRYLGEDDTFVWTKVGRSGVRLFDSDASALSHVLRINLHLVQ